MAQTIWDGHPLGRSVIGTRKTVSRLQRDDFLRYIEERYRPNNLVVTAAGNVEHAAVVGLIETHLGSWNGRTSEQPTETPVIMPATRLRVKDVEQVHLCLATGGRAQADGDLYVLEVLDNVLGSGMSSRLFHEIRENRGLVYTIASYAAAYREGGLFVIYAAMSPENGPEVVRLTLDEAARLAASLADHEVARARESLKGNLMLGLESTGSRMTKLARSELYYGRQVELDEMIQRIDAVTPEAVRAEAQRIFTADQLAMAAIGPFRAQQSLAADLERTFDEYRTGLSRPALAPAPASVPVPTTVG